MEMKPAKKCSICENLRPLSNHLFELSEMCRYLGNESEYSRGGKKRIVRTTVIGEWLKLAAELDRVEINAWKFVDVFAASLCEPIADNHDSDADHLSSYSTALTRFLFVCNALEEAYRYVDQFYIEPPDTPKNQRLREPSRRAAALVDNVETTLLPHQFEHFVESLNIVFTEYSEHYPTRLSGMDGVTAADNSYGLHLIRNLRNHIAHGVFPICPNPEYDWFTSHLTFKLLFLLQRSTRVAALYIQVLLLRFNSGFLSQDYEYMLSMDSESRYFSQHCKTALAQSLHMRRDFSFEHPFPFD